MTLAELKKFRQIAKANEKSHRSAGMILALCDEVERLKGLVDERAGDIGDFSLMPFGKHKGRKLADVPDDFLQWWQKQNNRDGLKIDADFASFPAKAIARKKLQLFDYIAQRLNGHEEIQSP